MPIFTGKCTCGYENEQFLKSTNNSVQYKCKGCKKYITITQVRDQKQVLKTNNEVTGVFDRE